MQKMLNKKTLAITASLAFMMLLTRGSHVLTHFALPDASLVIFLMGGLLLRRAFWFVAFFMLATVINFGAAAFDPAQGFCLTDGYWGLIPSYGAMWLGGLFLNNRDTFASSNVAIYGLVTMFTTFAAFVISTQTYYLFSGRFPSEGLMASMQHGWEYLPNWMGFAAMYFAMIWFSVAIYRYVKSLRVVNA